MKWIGVWIFLVLLVLAILIFFNYLKGLTDGQIDPIVVSELTSYCSGLENVANGSSYCYTCWRLPNDTLKVSSLEDLEIPTNHHYYLIEKQGSNYFVNLRLYLALGRATRGGMFSGNLTLDSNGKIVNMNLPEAGCI